MQEPLNFYPEQKDITPKFSVDSKQDFMNIQELNKVDQLLSTNDRLDLASSIQNLKYLPPKVDNTVTGCIASKTRCWDNSRRKGSQVLPLLSSHSM